MRLHRFYTKENLVEEIEYSDLEHIHQWRNVFRYKESDRVVLFGDGFEHEYEILSINKKLASLREISKIKSKNQDKDLTLAVALIKKENFELALSKCTEIGVTKFIPLVTDRSLHKFYNKERLQKILIEATEQSGWGRIPEIGEVARFENLISENCILFDISGEDMAGEDFSEKIICIGPEGGWSDDEIKKAKENAKIYKLRTGILRSETASIIITGIIKNTV